MTNIGNMLEARPDKKMGKGLYATVNIPVGTRLLVESPLVRLPQSPTPFREFCKVALSMGPEMGGLRDLDCNARLLNENLPGNILSQIRSEDPHNPIDLQDDSVMNLVKLYAIYYTNAVKLTEDDEDAGSAVFCNFSHLNHSCRPNVFSIFSNKTNQQTVYAGCDIKAGQQILISYFGGLEDFMTTKQRLEQTRRDWGFACNCDVCLDSNITDPLHERMRNLREELDESIKDWTADDHAGHQVLALEAIQKAEELLRLMKAAGVGYWKFRQM